MMALGTAYPRNSGTSKVEYTAFINIRPRQGNKKMEIEDPARQEAVRSVIRTLLPLA